MSSSKTTEKTFETAITDYLVEKNGYTQTNPQDFNRELALDTKILFSFLQETQPNEWQRSLTIHGNQIEQKLLARLSQEIDNRGILDVIRNGFTDLGVRYKLSYFQPSSKLNADAYRLYQLNKFTVTRQLNYCLQNDNSLDMVIGLNGIPIVTVELKNQFTNQNVDNAKKQYIDSRDPRELIFQFKKRSLVHFAVDTDQAYMTTKID
ncbi:MAG: type I restriction endonuclease, partial [Ignavibacteria bacterium]|nr:type I restriction endonuclease [Ignavibacteria bacterium]